MLTCREIAARASDYIERDLSLVERLQFRLHLALCAACRRYVQQMWQTTRALRALEATPDAASPGTHEPPPSPSGPA